MFKPGEIAGIHPNVGTDPHKVTILASLPNGQVDTNEGIFAEAALYPIHCHGGGVEKQAFRDNLEAEVDAYIKAPRLDSKLVGQVETALAEATIDWNGHWNSGKDIRKEFASRILKELFLGTHSMAEDDAKALVLAFKNKRAMARWVPLKVPGFVMSLRSCNNCGAEDFEFETNGKAIRFQGEACPHPNGLPPTEWELNVPSGKLVVANDLRQLFPLPEAEDFDINTTLGCRQTALAYAANGLSHAFVSNTCPGVYKLKGGSYKIASEPSDETWDEKKGEYVAIKPKPKFEGKRVAGICTDLWWYSICDHDEYTRRKARFEDRDRDIKVINVEPGVYRFRHYEEAGRKDCGPEIVFAQFERVRAPDPVKDYLAQYEEVDVNPHAFVQSQVARWPTLYGTGKKGVAWADMTEEQRNYAWLRVADRIFCTIGGGTDWHEKGFPRAKVDPSVPDIEPPSFRAQNHWYPFSKGYGGLFGEVPKLTPSFAKLAFRVLESVISFGTNVHNDNRSRDVRHVRARMQMAVERYRTLAKEHPNEADPEYVAWLGEKGRAEAWVKGFDLGPEFTDKHREHAKAQRWMPDDVYAIEFDARKLESGYFAWHPKVMGAWAEKKNAQRYAIQAWEDNGQAPEHNCFWSVHAVNTSIPLYSVARVKKVGEVSHMGDTLVELTFDYGTPWMKGKKRKAVRERVDKDAIRILTKAEYDKLLPKAVKFFETAEAKVKAKV